MLGDVESEFLVFWTNLSPQPFPPWLAVESQRPFRRPLAVGRFASAQGSTRVLGLRHFDVQLMGGEAGWKAW